VNLKDKSTRQTLENAGTMTTKPADYVVTISNIFEAESPEDAVIQMAEWLLENCQQAGYRVVNDNTGESWFIDAEDMRRKAGLN